MIGYLKGTVIETDAETLILNVSGVGYLVHANTSVIRKDEDKEFYIYTHVREDQLNLYGFPTQEELTLFKILISVKGVGPKVAMSILSNLSVEELAQAVLLDDAKTIQSVPGIGKKGAERIVLEIRGQIENLGYSAKGGVERNTTKIASNLKKEVLGALQNLGYNKGEAEDRLDAVMQDYSGEMKVETLIKLCLST